MATERQLAANRANALRSTGPKSAAGRKVVSRNARVSGVSAQGVGDGVTLDVTAWVEVIAASPRDETHDGGAPPASSLPLVLAQSEAWLARIRARLRAIDDRIDLQIAAGAFTRSAPVAEGTAMLRQLGLSDAVPAAVRNAAQRFLKDPGIAAILDPPTALLQERALLMRYRQEAEAARRSLLQHWRDERDDRPDAGPPSSRDPP